MSEVSQIWRTVLDAMPNGWTAPAAIALRLGRDVEETTDLLAALDAAGLISVQEAEESGDPVVMLAPRGLGVIRAASVSRANGPRDRREPVAAGSWSSPYERPSRSRIAATASGSVAS
jgi:hypothetical protein